ncbi:MAG: hypothetical protein J6W10_03650, partial [Kiritimatiellae bacterium]|nr:hypothetical protein [Kiritimatiellia bacterium]
DRSTYTSTSSGRSPAQIATSEKRPLGWRQQSPPHMSCCGSSSRRTKRVYRIRYQTYILRLLGSDSASPLLAGSVRSRSHSSRDRSRSYTAPSAA